MAQQADCSMSSVLCVTPLASAVGCCSVLRLTTVQHASYLGNLYLAWHVAKRQQEGSRSLIRLIHSLSFVWQPNRTH